MGRGLGRPPPLLRGWTELSVGDVEDVGDVDVGESQGLERETRGVLLVVGEDDSD